ncbi:hypothetical protein K1T71_008269 [Dendrolimus kikuchii]|uniref:Uncharacterized protein n=1 Tax=Dendrolimus kikuchii TaxID=765133 RepID=A0ACC1CX16_9NEOP|nr:hypothetical protein K1T71_008269 [Dendrolimus kikuchii]
MKEKKPKKEKYTKSKKRKEKKHERCRRSSSDSNSTESNEWIEKDASNSQPGERETWMSMTGMLKTYTRDDVRPKKEEKDKKHIDSYNPATSSRELNPYWKAGGSGLPHTAESFRKSRQFIKPPDDDDNYYSKPQKSTDYKDTGKSRSYSRHGRENSTERASGSRVSSSKNSGDSYKAKSYGWKKDTEKQKHIELSQDSHEVKDELKAQEISLKKSVDEKRIDGAYLSDEKMNKLAAKLVKAEIIGDINVVNELKSKLDAAREYRKQNPDAGQDNEGVMLITTNSVGNSRPLSNPAAGDARSKGGKRKADTHTSGQRIKYFGNDDKYDLAQMFQQEKYGNNYNEEAELAKVASKHTNPNDDLEDIFMDEITKTRNAAKDSEQDKQRAISEHKKIEKSLEGCEYCVNSKNMLKHLMISCGNKIYLAVPARKSLVKDQCIITTIQHNTCVTGLDEDIWEEIMNYRKALTQFFNSQSKDVVFYETATKLHRYPHVVINCVPMPRDVGDMAAIYFKKALLECEAEWSMNKKVVDLKGKNIRKAVPKGLPYFWIDFGMDPGFAHVIEDQQLFPKTFAEEVIAGILDLDHRLWKNPHKEYGDLQRKKVLDFIKDWKPFDPSKDKY